MLVVTNLLYILFALYALWSFWRTNKKIREQEKRIDKILDDIEVDMKRGVQ